MAKAAVAMKLEGADDLKRAFATLSAEVRREVKQITTESADEIKREAKARVRVRTGHTRDTIERKSEDHGLGAEVGTSWFIGRFIEHGTKKMGARPFLFPAFEIVRPKYLERLKAALYGVVRAAGGR